MKDRKDIFRLYPTAEYHECFGSVLWHHLPLCEPPYVGSGPGMMESDRFGNPTTCRRLIEQGWLTHWSFLPDDRKFVIVEDGVVQEYEDD